jgi:hypothetical protein
MIVTLIETSMMVDGSSTGNLGVSLKISSSRIRKQVNVEDH